VSKKLENQNTVEAVYGEVPVLQGAMRQGQVGRGRAVRGKVKTNKNGREHGDDVLSSVALIQLERQRLRLQSDREDLFRKQEKLQPVDVIESYFNEFGRTVREHLQNHPGRVVSLIAAKYQLDQLKLQFALDEFVRAFLIDYCKLLREGSLLDSTPVKLFCRGCGAERELPAWLVAKETKQR
jgi:hypothetical protein